MAYNQIIECYLSHLGGIKVSDISLFNGISADCLILHTLYEETGNQSVQELLMRKLYEISNNTSAMNMTFGRGWMGIMYMHSIIDKEFSITYNLECEFNNFIKGCLSMKNYDLQNGLIGAGLLSIEESKMINKKSERLNIIIKSLISLFVTLPNNRELVYYYIERHYLLSDKDEWCNMGLLHGLPSIIAFFLICIKEGFVSKSIVRCIDSFLRLTTDILDKTDYIVPTSLWPQKSSLFAGFKGRGLTYCTGCLGLINTLMLAYDTIGDNNCYNIAHNCFIKNIANLNGEQDMNNNRFCHGNAGTLYLLSKLSRQLQVPINKHVLSYMKERMLKEYLSSSKYQVGLLSGMTGLTLSLLWSASNNGNKVMERILLLD